MNHNGLPIIQKDSTVVEFPGRSQGRIYDACILPGIRASEID